VGRRQGARRAPRPQRTAQVVKTLGTGVRPNRIKVGHPPLVDFDCIKPYNDRIRLGQQAVYEAFIKT